MYIKTPIPDFSASVRLPASRAEYPRQSAPAARTASNAEVSVHRNNVQSAESIHPPPVIRRSWSHRRSESVSAFHQIPHPLCPWIRTVQLRRDAACPAIRQTSRSAICRELSTPPCFSGLSVSEKREHRTTASS